jgi:hypothetical protein
MDWSKIVQMALPVIVAAITWMISAVTNMQHDLVDIKSKMPALITPNGTPTDSPVSAEARHKLKEEIYKDIHDLQVRLKLLEERSKR